MGRQRIGAIVFTGAILFVSAFFIGCAAERPSIPPGRCFVNADCDDGFRCVGTYCEDIYHPRRDIKPY